MSLRISDLFRPLPSAHYTIIDTKADEFTSELEQILDGVGGELRVITEFSGMPRLRPRDNDTIIIRDVYASFSDQKALLKVAYTSLANAAYIVIMEKKGVLDLNIIKDELSSAEFRAVNEIDLVDGYDLVMGKKMHMWGNGL